MSTFSCKIQKLFHFYGLHHTDIHTITHNAKKAESTNHMKGYSLQFSTIEI